MPFWAGMLTEEQHPHPELERAIRQASWDLYFRDNLMRFDELARYEESVA